MLGFFTNTALQRLFTTQMTIPGTDRITTLFTMSLKPNLPEVHMTKPILIYSLTGTVVTLWE
jgi:hypothetical protein